MYQEEWEEKEASPQNSPSLCSSQRCHCIQGIHSSLNHEGFKYDRESVRYQNTACTACLNSLSLLPPNWVIVSPESSENAMLVIVSLAISSLFTMSTSFSVAIKKNFLSGF